MYAHICECMWDSMHTQICVDVKGGEEDVRCLPQSLSISFFEMAFY